MDGKAAAEEVGKLRDTVRRLKHVSTFHKLGPWYNVFIDAKPRVFFHRMLASNLCFQLEALCHIIFFCLPSEKC